MLRTMCAGDRALPLHLPASSSSLFPASLLIGPLLQMGKLRSREGKRLARAADWMASWSGRLTQPCYSLGCPAGREGGSPSVNGPGAQRPSRVLGAGGTLGLQGAGAGGSGCLQTVPNGDPELGDPEAIGVEPARWGVTRGSDLTAGFAGHESGLCVHPQAPYPGKIRFSSPFEGAHE